MHICVVTPYPPQVSGIGQFGWNLVHALAALDEVERITVLTSRERHANPGPVGKVEVRRVYSRGGARSVAMLPRSVAATGADIAWFNVGLTVFGSSNVANFAGLSTPWRTARGPIPTVVTLHEVFAAAPHLHFHGLGGRALSIGAGLASRMAVRADAVCVTLSHYVEALERAYGARNVLHVPHGAFIEPEILPPPPPGPEELLVFASWAPYKGLHVLMAAFEELSRERSSVRLTIAGSDHPRYPGFLQDLQRLYSWMPGVTWRGPVRERDLPSLFAAATVVVVPSVATTGSSSVIHRAAAWGRPVVASDLADFRATAAQEGLDVAWARARSPRDLAAAIRSLLDDPARRARMAETNLAAMRSMSASETARRYLKVFSDVIDARKARPAD